MPVSQLIFFAVIAGVIEFFALWTCFSRVFVVLHNVTLAGVSGASADTAAEAGSMHVRVPTGPADLRQHGTRGLVVVKKCRMAAFMHAMTV